MRRFLLALVYVLASSVSYADELTNKISEISKGIANLIPGEGYTETSIDLRNNGGFSPDFSILGVREIAPIDNGKIFTQFSFFNTESANGKTGGDERYIGNLGLGLRKLSADNTVMFGVNNFWDYDLENEHLRSSLGLEARSAVVEFNYNYYVGLGDSYNEEQVMDGHELQLASQIPHLHWAKIFINNYKWEGVLRDDVEGRKLGSEMQLTPNFNLEFAHDNKDKSTLEDQWYTKLKFVHPPVDGPTALDGRSDSAWKESRDMSGELLSKVNRQNKIMIEYKGTGTISRTD